VCNTHSAVKDYNCVVHAKNLHKNGRQSYGRYEENASQDWEKFSTGNLRDLKFS
jgi:hypothetical protein